MFIKFLWILPVLDILWYLIEHLCLRKIRSPNNCCARSSLSFEMLLKSLLPNIRELLRDKCVTENWILINDTFTLVHITLVTIESIDAGLHSLLHNKLLHHQISFTPVFKHICNELVLAKIDACDRRFHALPNDLKNILGRFDTIWPRIAPSGLY